MPPLTRSGYEDAYNGGADEFGHRMEDLLCQVMSDELEIPQVDRDVVGQKLDHFAFARATPDEDGQGVDILFYNFQSDRWVPMNFTVSNNPVDRREKERKLAALGGVVLKVPARTLELAARGAVSDIRKVAKEIADTFGIHSEK